MLPEFRPWNHQLDSVNAVEGMEDSTDGIVRDKHEGLQIPSEYFDPNEAVMNTNRRERNIAPGIYFTPGLRTCELGVGNVASETQRDNRQSQFTDVALLGREELIYQERELSKRVAKLKSSNEEMLQFDNEGDDPDLVQARAENNVAIQNGEHRLGMIRDRLRMLNSLPGSS